MATIEERVKKVTAETVKADPSTIKSDTRFVEDLGLDSMDVVELIIGMEEEFASDDATLEISDEEAQKFTSIAEVVSYLKDKGFSD